VKRILALIVFVFVLFFTAFVSAEEEDLIRYLRQARIELEQKEISLKQRELALKKAEKVLDRKIKRLNALVEELKQYLKDLEKMHSERIKHVVETYEKMAPEDAAMRLEGLPEDKATDILLLMKPRKAAKVLSNMDPRKATRLTERLTELGGFERIRRHLR
jgi:flagellar motility protein MotE (MotC chaperone)